MKKGLLLTTALTLTASAYGQVETSISSPSLKPFADVRMSHYTDQSDSGKITPKVRLRPRIGASLPKLGLDVVLLSYFYKKAESVAATQDLGPEAHLYFKGFQLGALSVEPYMIYYFAHKENGPRTLVSTYQSMRKTFSTTLGEITAGAGLEVGGTLHSQDQSVSYRGSPKLGLTAPQEREGIKTKPEFYHDTNLSVSLKPNAIRDLSLSFLAVLSNGYDGVYTLNNEERKSSHYGLNQMTYERLRVSYSLTDQLTARNDLYSYQSGVYASAYSRSLRNEVQLIYSF